jgi:O-antigen ligase
MGTETATQHMKIVIYSLLILFSLLTGLLIPWLIGGPNQLAAATFLLLAPFVIWCVANPILGFGISLLLLPLSYQFQIINLDLTVGEPFFIVAVGVLLILAIIKRAKLEFFSYGPPLVLLLVGLLFSLSVWPTETAFGVFRKALVGIIAFMALALARPSPRDLHVLTRFFTTSGLLVALVALLQAATGAFGFNEHFVQERGLFEAILTGQIFEGKIAEVRMVNSTFNHFNMAGAYLDLAFPFFLLRALFTKRVASWLSLSLIVVGINATHSRGSLLAVFITTAFLIFMLYRNPLSRRISFFLYSTFVLVVILSALALNYAETLNLYGTTGRLALWRASLESFRANPIFGNGLGRTADLIEEQIGTRYAGHSIYLQLLADTGIVGLIAFLLLVAVFFRHLRQLSGQEIRLERNTKLLALSWAGAMVGYLTHGLVDHAIFQPAFTAFFFTALAVMGLLSRQGALNYGR